MYTLSLPIGTLEIEVDGQTCTAVRLSRRRAPDSTARHPVLQALRAYVRGRRGSFDDIFLCVRGTPFQQAVWKELRRVPYGQTVTYGELAARVGCRSSRAVGQAVGANPLMILIPCHRVLPTGGSLERVGGFAYGAKAKQWLLKHEQEMCNTI